jgi:sensor histidine kinase regulating citrate/malate metabolism
MPSRRRVENFQPNLIQWDHGGVAEIVNTGRISEEDQERLLHGDGRGRGLHITIRLIKRMGGKLDVEAREGQTIFRVLLPMTQENERNENG